VVDEETPELIVWQALRQDGVPVTRQARLSRVIFVR
jgi:hypothetical protein